MADFFSSWHLLKVKRQGRDAWQGVLKYQVPNPQFVEDKRTPEQRRKSYGKHPNPQYIEDERTPEQRAKSVTKQIRKVFDPEKVRTKAQANAALDEWRKKMEEEHANADAMLTVHDFATRYISDAEKKGTISASTALDYRKTANLFSRGKSISGVTLKNLTPAMVERWEIGLLDSGLSGTTAAKAHRLLKMICEKATNDETISRNPVRSVKPPRRDTGRPNALDAEGRKKAMAALSGMEPTALVVSAQIALYLGLRRGEICALRWVDVDLDGMEWPDSTDMGPKLRVSHSVGRGNDGAYIKDPKTAAGKRVVPISGGLVALLKRRRRSMWEEWSRAMMKVDIEPSEESFSELFVVGDIDGSFFHPDRLTSLWASKARDLGLVGTEGRYVTFHDLRHTYATNAVTRNVDISSVAANLGHASSAVTLGMYTSHDAAAQRAGSNAVAADLDAARTGEVLPFVPRTGTEG